LFGSDPGMIEIGTRYLQIVGPVYGFFGGGLALYFASQGAGRVGWAMVVAVVRVLIAAGVGWFVVSRFGGTTWLFVTLAAALVIYGLANVVAVAAGAWFTEPKSKSESKSKCEPEALPAAQPS
jgi:Na+-driven multidrug efflux pump